MVVDELEYAEKLLQGNYFIVPLTVMGDSQSCLLPNYVKLLQT